VRRFVLLLLHLTPAIVACNSTAPRDGAPDAALVATTSASAPTPAAPRLRAPSREGGTLVRAATGDALYVADEDHGVVRRIPLPFDPAAPVKTIATPGLPAQVLALEDRILVTVRSEGGVPPAAPQSAAGAPGAPSASAAKPPAGKKASSRIPPAPTGPGLLLIFRPDPDAGLVELARVALPGDAWGIGVTPDEKTALVTSAWTHQVSAVDLAAAKKTWSIDVPREPRAVVVRPDGASAYVTHLVGGRITRLDGLAGQPTARPVSLPPSPLRSPSGKTLDGTLAYSATLSPDGHRLFVARHAIGALGEAAWFGAATIDVLLTADDTPLAPKRDAALPRSEAEIAQRMTARSRETQGNFPRVNHTPFSAPRAIVYRKRTSTLLVASEGFNKVVEFDARVVDPTMFERRTYYVGTFTDALFRSAESCGAPSGLALSEDESMGWVYCRTTNDLVQMHLDPNAKPAYVRLHLAEDLLGEEEGKGRRLFYDAVDVQASGGAACAACHPDGRDDGHVWHEAKVEAAFGEGINFLGDADQAPRKSTAQVGFPRQTPMLAGRILSLKGPYGWHGESPDLVARLVAGFDLHRWGRPDHGLGNVGRAQYLTLFLLHGLVPPPRDTHPMTPEETRGKEIFMSEQSRCARCHVPDPEYTDRMAYPLSPKLSQMAGFEDESNQQFKTPSLFFVAGTPPYFHDGRVSTLEALIEQNADRMGRTSHLSPEDRAALVAFLRTL
jgi:cytochrome c peroxidase